MGGRKVKARRLSGPIILLTLVALASCGEVKDREGVPWLRTVGPEGATIALGRLEVTIPAGALENGATIMISKAKETPGGNLGPAYEISPAELALNKDISLTYSLEGMLVDPDAGVPYLARVNDGQWQLIDSSIHNKAEEALKVDASQLGVWGVVQLAPCVPACDGIECGPDGCGGVCGQCLEGRDCVEGACLCPFGECWGECCQTNEVCFENACCLSDCMGKECGDNGCGGVCGSCPPGKGCKDDLCACPFEECGGFCCAEDAVCSNASCCTPSCEGRECGPDGCSGLCGACSDLQQCLGGTCSCLFDNCAGTCCAAEEICFDDKCCHPYCGDAECGGDGCGGSCGECSDLQVCVGDECCEPDCTDKQCGESDGCVGFCGNLAGCDDGNVCTLDLCEPELGCVYQAQEGECDDGENCTMGDHCDEGICEGEPKNCNPFTQGVCQGVCDPDSGNCILVPTGDGVETCDGLDNDCDGWTDEGLAGLGVEEACGSLTGVGVCTLNSLDSYCGVDPATGLKTMLCDLSLLGPLYIEEEDGHLNLCDAKDNDCDGLTDENLVTGSSSDFGAAGVPCLHQGVCKNGVIAMCNIEAEDPGNWTCNYDNVQFHSSDEGYTWPGPLGPLETACDGLDNDCDGEVDEDLWMDFGEEAGDENPKVKSGCPIEGPCAANMKWDCENVGGAPTWVCDHSAVPGFEEVEVTCDGVDNDCDGVTDEDLDKIEPEVAGCTQLGVCGEGGSYAKCIGGQQICYYEQVAHYEWDQEVTCDGLDNDCDGFTDEDLDWKEAEACSTKGVCASPALTAQCFGEAGWDCFYEIIEDWEQVEYSCDNLDNDCDGTTDVAVCQVCEPCQEDPDCMTNACKQAPSGESFCAVSDFNCVLTDYETGECMSVSDGTKACKDESSACLCAGLGTWYCAGPWEACTGATPACVDGVCKVCKPGKMKCDGNTRSQCSAAGDAWLTLDDCGANAICVGDALCVSNTEIPVADDVLDTGVDVSPQVIVRKSGGPVVVWHTDKSPGGQLYDISARRYSPELVPEGPTTLVNSYTFSNQKNPAAAAFPSNPAGFVVVWQSNGQDGDDYGIFGQMFNEDSSKYGAELQICTGVAGAQENPRVAAFANGSFIVTWESNIGADAEGRGVYAQRFDGLGQAEGPEFLVNTTTTNDQRWPDVANLDDEGFIITWTSVGQDESGQGVIFALFDMTGAQVSQEFIASYYQASSQKRGVAGAFSGSLTGQFMLFWESYGQDPGGANGVFTLPYDEFGLKQEVQDIQVNTVVTNGNQKDPAVAVLADNTVVVVWETMYLDSDKEAIAGKLLNPDGSPISEDEFLVNSTQAGSQQNPDVAAGPNQTYLVVWSSVPADNNPNIRMRLFKGFPQ